MASQKSPPMKRVRGSVADRIKASVEIDANGCWVWRRKLMRKEGYGLMNIARRTQLAHRASYEAFVGPIPEGMQLDHLCRVRACVNPEHLQPVSARENILRSPIAQGAINAAKTHCPQGHPYDEMNTYLTGPHGRWRLCRACTRERGRARYASKRGE